MKQFKEIFDAFYPKVYGYALKAGGQEWLAEEIAHNVFCKLWMHRDNLSLKGKDDKEVMSGQGENPVFRITKKYVPLDR